MANQELYDKTYKIPPEVLKSIQTTLISNPNGEGVKRAKFMLKNGAITYQAMKRLKNFFDYFNPEIGDKIQYALAGGNAMKQFIDTTLVSDRAGVQMTKDVKQDMTINPNSELKPYQTPKLNEEKKKKDELKKNAVAVIVDEDNKILLLKRGSNPKIWQPSKWALVGGGIEKGETPEKAIKREIKEEINVDIDKFIKSFTIQRNPDSIETIFACRYKGDPTDIKLNDEHTNYGWYDVDEMEYLDIVPNLLEYINLVFTKYD
ncbi:MAG: NUDIX hydrolase [Candidatus Paceibacterota bacterium]|jgi:mutator protein MutT